MFTAGIITVSDRSFKKEREDESGKVLQEFLANKGYDVKYYTIVPDEQADIIREIKKLSKIGKTLLLMNHEYRKAERSFKKQKRGAENDILHHTKV